MANAAKKEISDSLFNMWRCVIALAHMDGKVQEEERQYLEGVISNLDRVYHLKAEQKKTLANDLAHPHKISELLPKVTAPQDRASLVYFGDILVWKDGELSTDEEAVLKKLHDGQMSKIDLDTLRKDIKADLAARAKERAKEQKAFRAEMQKKTPTLAALDRILKRFGIDMLD